MKEYRINLNDEEYRLDDTRPLSDLFNQKESADIPWWQLCSIMNSIP